MTRAQRLAYWALPCLFCLLLYWHGIRAWFQQDDFAWLGLGLEINSLSDLPKVLFSPKAQGTIRPWSERIYFLVLHAIFGMRATPFKLVEYLTACVDFVLLALVVRKTTGSQWAGFLAPFLWICNAALITPLSWASCYNELQCSAFILGAFYCFLRYLETSDRRWYWAQFAIFVLGFGSLELNVVYPGIALAYAILCARKGWRSTLPLFVLSAAYTLVHRAFAPRETAYVYRMYFDGSILNTFETYWSWVLGPGRLENVTGLSPMREAVLLWLPTLALAGFALWQAARRRNFFGLFCFAWYCALLLPLLPLKNHITDYYLTMPALGLSMWGGWAIAYALRSGWLWRVVAVACAACYVGSSLPVIRAGTFFYEDRGAKMRHLVQSLAYIHKIHPDKLVILRGLSSDLFYSGVYDRPARIFGMTEIYVAPELESEIHTSNEMSDIGTFFLPASVTRKAIERNAAVVYQWLGTEQPLRNITSQYFDQLNLTAADAYPRRVELGETLFADQVGAGWYGAETGFRWMSKQATVTIGGPTAADQQLWISAYCPPNILREKPMILTVSVDGTEIGRKEITAETGLDLPFRLPASLIGHQKMSVTLTTDRTFRIGADPRDLSLAVRLIAVR